MPVARAPAMAARAESGFAYLFVLLFMALFGAISAGIVAAGSNLAQRDAEEELLYTGTQFRNAIRSYYDAGAGARRYALTFQELLRDPRIPGIRRHLRRIHLDPLTGKDDWGILQAPGGGIMGVYSKSAAKPIKVEMFAPEYVGFANKEKYSEWVFAYAPPGQVLPGASIGAAPANRVVPAPATPFGAPPAGNPSAPAGNPSAPAGSPAVGGGSAAPIVR